MKHSKETREKALKMYYDGKTNKEIWEALKVSKAALSRWRKIEKLPIREDRRPSLSAEHKKKISKSLKGKFTGKERWSYKPLKEGYEKLTIDLAYIVGVMMGDGYIHKHGIGLETKDKDFANTFKEAAERQFGREIKEYKGGGGIIKDWRIGKEYKRSKTTILRLNSITVKEFLENILND